ncbi:MAG: hypothetical protein RLO12_06980 [Fulvivirga sp.]|uniref:hypothetical protein n=1 Tax=Fulvivirga sp. TaxID=1931237 RepID=UPI0032FA5525
MINLYLAFHLFLLTQNPTSSEQKALDYFQKNIFLDQNIYKNPCDAEDPDCIHLEALLPDKFLSEKFLEHFTLFINPIAKNFPTNNTFPDSLELKIYGQELFDRKVRIASAINQGLQVIASTNKSENSETGHLIIRHPFVESDKKYNPTINEWIYLEVSKAIFTGKEYYVEIDLYTNYYGPMDYNDSFGYQFIYDQSLDLVSWDTTY